MVPSDIVLGLLVILVFLLAITFVAHIFLVVPYVPTPWTVVREMIRVADLRPGQTVYDLGAGDARLLIAAKRACPGIIAKGCELVPTIWLLGKMRMWFSGEQVSLRLGSAFRQNVSDADVLFLYLLPEFLGRLESRLDAQLRPGTLVISHAFRFPHRQPVREVAMPWGKREKKIYIYTW